MSVCPLRGAGLEEGPRVLRPPLVPAFRVSTGHGDAGVLGSHGRRADLITDVDHWEAGVGSDPGHQSP